MNVYTVANIAGRMRGVMASKPKPAIARWLIDLRKAHGLSVADIARVTDRTEATVRGWEAGRPPQSSDPTIAVLESYFGSQAPRDAAEDQADLAAAIRLQAAAIDAQAAAIEVLAAEIRVAALSVLSAQAGTGELLADLVDAARAGSLDALVRELRVGTGR